MVTMQLSAFAGTSGGSRTSSSSTSTSSARSSSTSSSRTPDAPKTSRSTFLQRSAAGPTIKNAAGAMRTSVGRRSLLDDAPAPSTRLANVIQQRESSGPGWLGTAFLISLLSQHDLSKDDRGWIQGRIDALKGEEGENSLLPATSPAVRFSYLGLKPSYKVGESIELNASASSMESKPVPIECAFQGAIANTESGRANIKYRPAAPAVQVLSCRAGGRTDRRLIKVGT